MGTEGIKQFSDLTAWQKGHELLLEIYKVTKRFPKDELYGMVSQLRRAALSVTNNIAEGFGRYHFKEKSNFYCNARGSLSEVQNVLLVARDLGFLSKKEWSDLQDAADSVAKLLNGLIRSVHNQLS